MQAPVKPSQVFTYVSWLLFTFAVFIGLMKLAHWQYNRGVEKENRLAKIAHLQHQAPLSIAQVAKLAEQHIVNAPIGHQRHEAINDLPVIIKGEFNNDHIFLLDNQVYQGQIGYRVLQVVTSLHFSVLVNLGWVRGSIDRSQLPQLTAITTPQQFQGNVRVIESGIMLKQPDFSTITWPLRVQQIDLGAFSALLKDTLKSELLPFVVYVNEQENLGYQKHWQPIVMPPQKHHAYAFQWLCLAIAWLMLMAWVSGTFRQVYTFFNHKKMMKNIPTRKGEL